jgi:hypothetical protein
VLTGEDVDLHPAAQVGGVTGPLAVALLERLPA